MQADVHEECAEQNDAQLDDADQRHDQEDWIRLQAQENQLADEAERDGDGVGDEPLPAFAHVQIADFAKPHHQCDKEHRQYAD